MSSDHLAPQSARELFFPPALPLPTRLRNSRLRWEIDGFLSPPDELLRTKVAMTELFVAVMRAILAHLSV